ncbi:hypothetical protein WISP_134984 [Willisornis vidua]|uniref:BTB domain-containing protein n=1 Tax=Willisornis vidua TaxID=1566151 RepID=A0ABQ9CTJ8_9PASS|nr:hypothetical protein WISP_134984 [Willisornis vidua]
MSSHMPECTSKCRSLQHALDVISVVTRGSEGQIKAFLSSYCYNAATIKDAFGRNVIHLASSCGKKGVLDWLAETKGVDLLAKDKESGWTALHRSIFYGYIDCVLSLLKHGVSLYVQDKEGLSALDLVMKDRPIHVVFRKTDRINRSCSFGVSMHNTGKFTSCRDNVFITDPTEVYTWGNNINFTLGHGGQQGKHHPELLDLFPRNGVYIKQVPRLVEGLAGHQCSQIAAAKDHTVVLTEDGYVYTFGLNTFHQLGILPPPSNCSVPRQVQAKNLKGRMVIGVAAGRFHTVLWTKEAVYTMGLNGGQLGYLLDPNGEKCVTAPRQVSALHHKDISVSLVSASDGATLNLKKVLVSGGYLEYKVDTQHLKENGGQKICILALDEAGRVFCWKSSSNSMKQCRWVYGRQVFMSDVALNGNEIMFVTQDGEAFTGKWLEEGKKVSERKELVSSLQNSCDVSCEHDANSVYERIRLQKLTFVHRAVSIATDPSGCNFAVLQSDPKTSLYEIPSVSLSSFGMDFGKLLDETDEMDSIHDVTFQIGTRTYPVHKYILAVRSDFFRKLFVSSDNQLDTPDIYRKDEDAVGCDLYVIEKVHPDLFAYLLQFIYTDTCDLLTHGYKPKIPYKEKSDEYQDTLISNLSKMSFDESVNGKSAFEIYRNNQVQGLNEKQKSKSKRGKAGEEANLIKMLQSAAKKFGLSNLSGRLDGVRLENGKINVVNKKNGNKPKLNQKKCSYLCDVTLKSLDGKEFPCHKCVLCARLDYFHSMLSSSWIEATCCSALEMPIHSEILQIIVDYLYTDEALAIKDSQNVEFICNVLVVADQLLISRLKEMCEVAIAEKLTLKNAAELLEFSAMYNAEQLKLSCLQFIGLNMAALLEARTLDVLSDEVVKDLSAYYRKMIPAMVRRVITPYPDGPDISSFEPEDGENFVFLREEMNTEQNSHPASPPAMDLRTIMEMEESMQKCGTMPKANSGRMMSHGIKLSQKQRKMIALAAKDNGSVTGNTEPTTLVTTPPPPTKVAKLGNAWSSSLHSALPKSFRDLVMEEEKCMSLNNSPGTGIKRCGYKGSEDSPVQNTLRCTSRTSPGLEDHGLDAPQLESHNPWSAASPTSPPVMAPVMFSAIVEEELQQEAALIRSREKPLALIQIEECAIQDLLIHYEAFDNPDEFVTVERAPQGPIAAPMWNKH